MGLRQTRVDRMLSASFIYEESIQTYPQARQETTWTDYRAVDGMQTPHPIVTYNRVAHFADPVCILPLAEMQES